MNSFVVVRVEDRAVFGNELDVYNSVKRFMDTSNLKHVSKISSHRSMEAAEKAAKTVERRWRKKFNTTETKKIAYTVSDLDEIREMFYGSI